jgi:hypothetical protein
MLVICRKQWRLRNVYKQPLLLEKSKKKYYIVFTIRNW